MFKRFKALFHRPKKLPWDSLSSEQKMFYMILKPHKKDTHFET